MNIRVYGRPNCAFCDRAKEWLNSRGLTYEYISLDTDEKKQRFKQTNPHLRTVPQIFLDSEHIGGYTDLVESNLAERVKRNNG